MKAIHETPVHGTAVAVGGQGFLIVGPSGSGKSGLAIQMIALGAQLVSDDQVELIKGHGVVGMQAPVGLGGLIEARYVGLLNVKPIEHARLHHVVDLNADAATRLPQLQVCEVLGVRIDLINGGNVPNLASTLLLLGRGGRSEGQLS